jgi:TolB-like protein
MREIFNQRRPDAKLSRPPENRLIPILKDFVRQLQQRKVFRVASVYTVTMWILVQGAIDLFPVFGIPDWGIRMLVVVVIIGLPVAVILAWAYEVTSKGLVKDSDALYDAEGAKKPKIDFVIIAAVLVLVLFFVFRNQLIPETEEIQSVSGQSVAATSETFAPPELPAIELHPQSIAVLPFLNMSSDEDTEYFSDGITEELLNVLANIAGLRVSSRTSSFALKDSTADIPTISRKLKVAYVLEGSVRRSGNKIRITAQLIDARDDVHLWSETYDREMLEVFAIQDEISKVIVDTLKPTILASRGGVSQPASITDNAQAYDLYLRGRSAWSEIDSAALEDSISKLEASIALDSGFARAHSALARSLLSYSELGENRDAYRVRAFDEAKLALRLDNRQREAHEILKQQ